MDIVGILAKAPLPGLVKTRLAATIGPQAATALYRRLGREVITRAAYATPDHDTTVWYTPSGRRLAILRWLKGIPRLRVRAQPEGDLGRRLQHAFACHFAASARRVVLIGTDCPGVTEEIMGLAFAALKTADVVLGPAVDGGYYLVGLRKPQPELFEDVPWSTEQVCEITLQRARALACSIQTLPPLRDIDTWDDARALGFLPERRRYLHR